MTDKQNLKPTYLSLLAAFQYIALINIAIAQPLYTVLKHSPEIFTAHKISGISLIIGSLYLSIGLGFTIYIVTFLLSRFNKHLGTAFHNIIIIILITFFTSTLLKSLIPLDNLFFTLSIVAGIVLGTVVCSYRSAQQWLLYLSIIGIVFPILFLTNSNIRPLISSNTVSLDLQQDLKAIPVILVVFDQLPLSALIDSKGRIDKNRYPNFAALSDRSNWFRNATSTAQDTITGIPAILTGNYPHGKKAPTIDVFPRNLFSYLEGSVRENIIENTTNLHAHESTNFIDEEGSSLYSLAKDIYLIYLHMILPTFWTDTLPSIEDKNSHFWPAKKTIITNVGDKVPSHLKRFIKNFSGDRSLHYLHLHIPHGPYRFHPSGKRYTWQSTVPGLNELWGWWPQDETPVIKALQRFLLQVQLTDTYLGKIISGLEEIDTYEKSLIIVTSDHGASFNAADHTRAATKSNKLDVLFVPLFIKLPGQKQGRLHDENVETIDIFPTIMDILGGDKSWKLDGISLLDKNRKKSTKKAWVTRDGITGLHEFPDLSEKGFEELTPMSERFIWDEKLRWPRIKSNRDNLIGQNVEDVTIHFLPFDPTNRGFVFDKSLSLPEAERELNSGWIRGVVMLPKGHKGEVDIAVVLRNKIIAISSTFKHKGVANYFAELIPEGIEGFDASKFQVRVLLNESTRTH